MDTLIRTGLGLIVMVGVTLGLAASADASIGVGIQSNPVLLAGVAHPGGSYTLPSLYVVNTGTEAESITVQVEHLVTGTRSDWSVPGSWIQVADQGTQLAPAQSAQIPLVLHTPGNARSGSYATDLVVTGSAAGTGGGVNVKFGAAAATGLEFRVTPGPAGGVAAWRWWLVAALALLTVIILVIQRTGLRIRFEMRGTHGT
jgi:hypothetical protein